MSKKRFTDLAVRALPEGVHYDQATPAFGLRVGKKRRVWFVIRGKARQRTTIGQYPAIPLADARRRALVLLGTTVATKSSISFASALDSFLEAKERTLKPRSFYELKRSLKHFTFKEPLDRVRYEAVARVIDALHKTPSEAGHAYKDIRTFFNWCVPRYLAQSPIAGMKPPAKYTPRTRMLDNDELRAVWHAAEKMNGYGRQVQLLIMTGQRANQIISLKPQWIDRKQRLINFPASVMKGNADHTIPYGPLTEQLLDFDDRPTSYQGKKKLELDALSGVTDWVLHDLRRVYASQLAELGVTLPTIEKALAHRSGSFAGIVAVYQKHSWLAEMRQAIELWENKLQSLVGS